MELRSARQAKPRWEFESLLTVGSAIAWGALAVSVVNYVEFFRSRRERHVVSSRLLAQVFPRGRVK